MSRVIDVSRVLLVLLVGSLVLLVACDWDRELTTGPDTELSEGEAGPTADPGTASFTFVPPICDDAGPDDEPAQSDVQCMSRADDVAGFIGAKWSWDNTNVWTGSGQTGDGCALFDTDGDGNINFAACAQFTNNPTGTEIIQLPSAGAVLLYSCGDKKPDRCTQSVTPLTPTHSSCTVELQNVTTTGFAPSWGANENAPNDVVASCGIKLTEVGAADADLVNVCTFPSGSPNSNPFDCVITPGSGYLLIQKVTTPNTTSNFDFTLSPAAIDGGTAYAVPGDDGSGSPGSSSLIPVAPTQGNTTYSLTETVPAGWSLTSASCTGSNNGTFNGTNAITGIQVSSGQTVTCTFNNAVLPTITVSKTPNPSSVPETGGNVQFDLVVTNTSGSPLTLNSLSDDVFGDVADASNSALTGGTTCTVPQNLAAAGEANDSYSCNFTVNLAGAAGSTHTDTVTAGASNAAGSTTAEDDATVTFTDEQPMITVAKTPNPTSVPETGGAVVFSVLVTNTADEPVQLTALSDDVFGNVANASNALLDATNCSVPQNLDASGGANDSYSCTFTATISGSPGVHEDTVTATAKDDENNEATAEDDATVIISAVDPTISLTKTPDKSTVPETGGTVTYTILVDNTSAETITLTSLTDNQFGDLTALVSSDCSMPQNLNPDGQAGDSYSCTFSASVSGDYPGSHDNIATASGADDDGQPVSAMNNASVGFDDVLPDITVTKTADPTSVPETGGVVTYSVNVQNNSTEAVTITSLTDDVFGDITDASNSAITWIDCAVPQNLAPTGDTGDDYDCSFSATVADLSGTPHVNTVTAIGADDDGNTDTETDDATVTFTDVPPMIDVEKTANPTSVEETGGVVAFTVLVTNNSPEQVTLTTLTDDVFGNLNGKGDCATGGTIAASGGTYTCTFSESISGNAGGTHVDTVTATAQDPDGSSDTAMDDATVSFTDVLPDITVDKSVNPTTLSAGPVTPVPPGPGPGDGPFFLEPVCDDAGPNDEPAQSDLNCFTRADNVADELHVRWSWDSNDVWYGTGQTGDACSLIDADGDGNADYAICAQFTNDPAAGTQGDIAQLPSVGSAIAYSCGDKKADRCAQKVTPLTSIGSTSCTVEQGAEDLPENFVGTDGNGNDVFAACSLDLTALPAAAGEELTLLNVCSFPSGSPNSNPFDCVVTPGAGFLVIEKATNPSSGQGFEFTVSPNPATGTNPFTVAGSDGSGGAASSELIAVLPGSYSITETTVTNWTLDSVSCDDGSGTFNGTNAVSGVSVQSGETVTCRFTNTWSLTGDVTYTIVVTNNSAEAATLDSLNDDKFGDLDGQGSCSLTQPLAPTGEAGASYTCMFMKSLSGMADDTHKNVVTAVASDNDGNMDTETDDATVTFVGP